MCIDAAEVLGRQACKDYGFGSNKQEPDRARQLFLLSKDDLAELPTNHPDAERNFSMFGRKAPVPKFRNKKFTAKDIQKISVQKISK